MCALQDAEISHWQERKSILIFFPPPSLSDRKGCFWIKVGIETLVIKRRCLEEEGEVLLFWKKHHIIQEQQVVIWR